MFLKAGNFYVLAWCGRDFHVDAPSFGIWLLAGYWDEMLTTPNGYLRRNRFRVDLVFMRHNGSIGLRVDTRSQAREMQMLMAKRGRPRPAFGREAEVLAQMRDRGQRVVVLW